MQQVIKEWLSFDEENQRVEDPRETFLDSGPERPGGAEEDRCSTREPSHVQGHGSGVRMHHLNVEWSHSLEGRVGGACDGKGVWKDRLEPSYGVWA